MTPYPHQSWIIESILDADQQNRKKGHLVILPTGFGKSFCYLEPAKKLSGYTLVFYPLRALAMDQIRRAEKDNIPAFLLMGGLSSLANFKIWIKNNKNGLILATLEMAFQTPWRNILKSCDIRHLVLDEAHTYYQWGLSFRPLMREIPKLIEDLCPLILSALTATASQEVKDDLSSLVFQNYPMDETNLPPFRENQFFGLVPSSRPFWDLTGLLRLEKGPQIVFVSNRKSTKSLALELWILMRPRRILYYHAGLDYELREGIEKDFLASSDAILVTTKAYGMGMDKPDIRQVIHYEPPQDLPSLLQESGRGGRDGKSFDTWLITEEKYSSLEMIRAIKKEKLCRKIPLISPFHGMPIPCGNCDLCRPDYAQKKLRKMSYFGPQNKVKKEKHHFFQFFYSKKRE